MAVVELITIAVLILAEYPPGCIFDWWPGCIFGWWPAQRQLCQPRGVCLWKRLPDEEGEEGKASTVGYLSGESTSLWSWHLAGNCLIKL
jgi:hypothetical protein